MTMDLWIRQSPPSGAERGCGSMQAPIRRLGFFYGDRFMLRVMLRTLVASAVLLWASSVFAEPAPTEPAAPTTLSQLQSRLAAILKETHLPGVSVAIVRADGPEWIGAIGVADVASGQPATADTLFRIGSTSKAFVSLSILQLVEAGKVRLEDPVTQYIGTQWFQNPWEAAHPTLIVDLLEHTTGWDDMHLRDFAKQAPGMTLADGLDYDPSSRVARWRPGTRMAYCNSALAVAALVIEKVTGQRFEDYVQQHLFTPIGMTTATYFAPEGHPATTLYHDDGKTPFPYSHITVRPAGAINASARDMAAYVALYLHRGSIGATPLVSSAAIDRMEVPTRTFAARDGLQLGYGLSNYAVIDHGFVYHGHDGGVMGGVTQMAYLKDAGVGYFFSINAGNAVAFKKIADAIRGYITHDLVKPAVPAAAPMPSFATAYAGWYQPDSPRAQNMYFVERLMGLTRVQVTADALTLQGLMGPAHRYVAVQGRTLRLHDTDADEPVASLALITPNAEGRFIGLGEGGTFKQVPGWQVWAELGGLALWCLAVVATLLYAVCWLGAALLGRRRPMDAVQRRWLLAAVGSLVAAVVVLMVGIDDLLMRFGAATAWSVAFCLLTLIHALATLVAAWTVFGAAGARARPWVRRYARLAAAGLLIGMRTWA